MTFNKPVLLFGWVTNPVDDEVVEIKSIIQELNQQQLVMPKMTEYSCSDYEPSRFMGKLRSCIQSLNNIQLLYLSCHGNNVGISGDTNPKYGCCKYADLVDILNDSKIVKGAELIFGSCHAFSDSFKAEIRKLNKIKYVWGFNSDISSQRVADLMANRILATSTLIKKISQDNKQYSEYLSSNNQPDSQRFFDKSINDFDKDAISYSEKNMVSLAIKKQNWKFYTHDLSD